MSRLELQYFKACYGGNVSELQAHGLPESVAFSFHFSKTSSYYYNTGRESMTYSPLCILSLSYELWQFFREHNFDINYDATIVCKKIEQCFELLGFTPGEFGIDYYSMYYLKCSLLEGEEWFDDNEQQNLIKTGFKQADISLFNAAQKCNIELVKRLLQEGSNPTVNLYGESIESDLFNTLNDDISVNLWFYKEYYETCHLNNKLNDDYTRSMLCVLFNMASSARLLRLIKGYSKFQYLSE